jgi:hypothetical protein
VQASLLQNKTLVDQFAELARRSGTVLGFLRPPVSNCLCCSRHACGWLPLSFGC